MALIPRTFMAECDECGATCPDPSSVEDLHDAGWEADAAALTAVCPDCSEKEDDGDG